MTTLMGAKRPSRSGIPRLVGASQKLRGPVGRREVAGVRLDDRDLPVARPQRRHDPPLRLAPEHGQLGVPEIRALRHRRAEQAPAAHGVREHRQGAHAAVVGVRVQGGGELREQPGRGQLAGALAAPRA